MDEDNRQVDERNESDRLRAIIFGFAVGYGLTMVAIYFLLASQH